MTFSDLRKALASTLASGAVLLAATVPAGTSLAQAQDNGAPANVAPRNTPRPAGAQASGEDRRITLNFDNVDLGQVVDAVQMVTGKSFIVDPRVRAQVTMRSSTPVTPEVMYQTFLSILAVHQFIAVPGAGGTIKIVPDANQRYYPGSRDLQDQVSATSDEVVTQVIAVKNVSAAQLVTVLRPYVPTTGQINAYIQTNMIIISDHSSNVKRMMKIIARIDQVGDADVEVIPMQNASATEVARVLTSLYQGQAQQDPGVPPLKLVSDDRSNSILISGEPGARLRIKTLIASMDTPQQGGGDTSVRYLHYADADKLAPKLNAQLSGVAAATGGTGAGAGAAASPAALESKNSLIWADVTNNALVITAPPKVKRQINEIVDKLDIPRAQVLVEAIIVDVDIAKASELGVNWALWSSSNGSNIPGATFLTPVGGASLVDLANAVNNPTTISSALQNGTTIGLGRIARNGLNFAAMLRAIRNDTSSNIIATPSALATDHQEATMKSADEVPFVTGQYTNTGAAGGAVSPFQTIQREEVGTILKVTPQINEGDAIQLKIDIESSSVIPSPAGAVDITTAKREISTQVRIEDGGIIVIGGLISNEYDHTEVRVPWLGRIPVLGELFKDHSATHTKKNLMVFIRPQIIHDAMELSIETNSKYNFIREEQRQVGEGEGQVAVPLLPGTKSPVLPPMPPPSPPHDKATPAAAPTAPAASSAPQAQQ